MGGPLFAMRRSTTEDDNDSFSFDLGRMTGPVEVLQKRESSIFKDKKGKAIQLKAGTSVVMVKFFERDAVCPNHFIFDGRAGGLRDLGPCRYQGHRGEQHRSGAAAARCAHAPASSSGAAIRRGV